MDLPRRFTIREAGHRILDPFDDAKLATLGNALRMSEDTVILDLACGKGEMLSTWARDHGTRGLGVDISTVFLHQARERAAALGVADRIDFRHEDATGFIAAQPVDVACCMGATWIGDGVPGTIELLQRSVKPGGIILIGEPFWREMPTPEAAIRSHASSVDDFLSLPALVESYGELGYDLVEMVLADEDSWDRYVAAQWLNLRRFIDANPDDDITPELREELRTSPINHVRYGRRHLGWGVFALMQR